MAPAQDLYNTFRRVIDVPMASIRIHAPAMRRWDSQDLVAYCVIGGGGALVLVLFLWAHLGLGALLVPPAASARQQVAVAGPYRIHMTLDASSITVGQEHTAIFAVSDTSGRPVGDAVVQVQPVMLSMPMSVPPTAVSALGNGQFRVRPIFSMAGSWQLDVTVERPGQSAVHTVFPVNVAWN